MNELVSVFPVLFLVYTLQCIAAAPPASVVFYLNHNLRGRLLRRCWQVGRFRHKLFLHNPFAPLTGAAYVDPLPFTVFCDVQGQLLGLKFDTPGDLEPRMKQISFDKPHKIGSRAKQVFVDGQSIFSAASEPSAEHVANILSRLCSVPIGKRMSLLKRECRKMFSMESLDDLLQQYSRSTMPLHAACISLFIFLFLIAPLLTFFFGLSRLWLPFLIYLVFLACSILWLFHRSYRNLYPGKSTGHSQRLFTIALSPFAAIRANDFLLTDLLSGFHPMAVARRLLQEDEFLEFAGAEFRKAKFLLADAVLLQFLTEFLVGQTVEVESLLRPPKRDNSRSRSYCPVCLTQYVIESGVCRDCYAVSLHPFATDSDNPTKAN